MSPGAPELVTTMYMTCNCFRTAVIVAHAGHICKQRDMRQQTQSKSSKIQHLQAACRSTWYHWLQRERAVYKPCLLRVL